MNEGSGPTIGETGPQFEKDFWHREEVTNLAVKFLHQKNPTVAPEFLRPSIPQDVFSDSKSLERLISESQQKEGQVKGFADALSIARFYWDNPLLQVPREVTFLHSGEDNPKLAEDPKTKVLVVVDEGYNNGSNKDHFSFADTRRKGWKTVPQTRPDVYLKSIALIKKSQLSSKEEFSIKGCDNLLVACNLDPLQGTKVARIDMEKVQLSCEEKMVFLPGAVLSGGLFKHGFEKSFASKNSYTDVTISTGGDIIQYPESTVRASSIRCNNYIQNGGRIEHPESRPSIIHCSGEFIKNGGTRGTPSNVQIQDGTNEWGLVVETGRQQELTLPATGPQSTEGRSGVKRNELDVKYGGAITTELVSEDGRERIRSYNISADSAAYSEFAAHAAAEGWRIAEKEQFGGIMSVTLKRNKSKINKIPLVRRFGRKPQ